MLIDSPAIPLTDLYQAIITSLEPDKLLLPENVAKRLGQPAFEQAVAEGWLLPLDSCGRRYYFFDRICWLPGRYLFTTERGNTVEQEINQHGYPASFDEVDELPDRTDQGVWKAPKGFRRILAERKLS